MGTQITLTIPDEIYQQAKQLAQATDRKVADVLVDSIVLDKHLDEESADETEKAINAEIASYREMHSTLWQTYPGKYVAIHQGKLIDHDTEFAGLYERIHKQFPDVFVLIRQVEAEPEKTYYFRSPRFAREK